MDDYINRAELLKKQFIILPSFYDALTSGKSNDYVIDVEDVLSMPSVDAVEVVRCKDCKHHKRGVCEVENYFVMTDNDFYCARGEKE